MTDQQHDVAPETESNANPAALSLVGGFVGTVTGLKRNGISGAVVGGLVGGTVGYVSGASLNDDGSATPAPEVDTEPVSVTVSDDESASEETTDADEDDEDDTDE